VLRAFVVIVVACLSTSATADKAPEPTGPHPRILLDESLRAAWKQAAKVEDSAVHRAIRRCEATRKNPKDFQRDSYMGFDWHWSLNACLISWVVRGSDDDARSAVVFVKALLDDLQHIGDGKGGEKSVRRDTGYAIRSVPPYVAIAYDWLYDHPEMVPLREKIRERMEQWLGWYKKSGYHNRSPATNYHAGYVLSASLAAIALGGEGGPFNTELWNHVRDDIWGTDMAKALATGGLFDGGDFPEGWQYAPLSVVEYALTARVVGKHGVSIENVDRWLSAMFVRTVHARSGALDTIAVIGDTTDKTASIPVHALTLQSILLGPAPEIAQRQARFELERLKLRAKEYPLYEALAEAAAVTPAAPVLDKWPTSYYATGIAAFYARTSWAKHGVWMATICPPQYDADHLPPSAGNVILTRGVDEVLVDPSPYGSLSTLTSNAPTVDSKQQVPKYRPSQAPWGETTHFVWAQQTASGVIATRCNYADQYKFQERKTDIPLALRDIVLVPWGKDGADASVVVVDRAETGAVDQHMYLRFRSPGTFALQGDVARTKVGDSTFTVKRVTPATVAPEVRTPKVEPCWEADRGKCDSARIPVGEYRIQIPGPAMESIHVLDAARAPDLAIDTVADGVVHLRRGDRDAYVAARPVSYTTRPSAGAIHVLLDPAAGLAVSREGDRCKIEVTEGTPREPTPFVISVDASCQASEDARTGPAAPDLAGSAAGTLISVGAVPQRAKKKGGCCDAGAGGAGSAAFAVIVIAHLRRRYSPRRSSRPSSR
jgi:hypothetical protein